MDKEISSIARFPDRKSRDPLRRTGNEYDGVLIEPNIISRELLTSLTGDRLPAAWISVQT